MFIVTYSMVGSLLGKSFWVPFHRDCSSVVLNTVIERHVYLITIGILSILYGYCYQFLHIWYLTHCRYGILLFLSLISRVKKWFLWRSCCQQINPIPVLKDTCTQCFGSGFTESGSGHFAVSGSGSWPLLNQIQNKVSYDKEKFVKHQNPPYIAF
jgi:hypothetical protein